MTVMAIIILFVLGLCLGSFTNAFIWRFRQKELLLAAHETRQSAKDSKKSVKQAAKDSAKLKAELNRLSVTKGRSMCVHCHHELAAKDLIPVVSYVMLRGKCRYCGNPIQDTPLAELLTPALFILSYIFWPLEMSGAGQFAFGMWLVFLVGFVILSIYDLRWFELPHRIVLPLIGLALVQVLVSATVFGGGLPSLLHAFWGALLGGGVFYALYMISPKEIQEDGSTASAWIGGGDITLGTLLGLLVGGPGNILLLIFLASLIGTLLAVPLMLAGRATRSTHLPFGPFLIASAVIVKLFGAAIIGWYMGFVAV